MRLLMHMPHLLLLTRVAMSALLLGLTLVACGRRADTPVSPTPGGATDANAAADGSTLKVAPPATVSPAGGAQAVDPLLLTASKSAGKFVDVPVSYRFQVRSGAAVVYDSGVVGGAANGNNVTHTVPSAATSPDTDYTWRARSEYQGAFSAWSSDASFRSPVGAYIRGNEVRDP